MLFKKTILISGLVAIGVILFLLGVPILAQWQPFSSVCRLPKASAQDNPCLAQEATISAMNGLLLQATLDHMNAQATISALQTAVDMNGGQVDATPAPPPSTIGLVATAPLSTAELDSAPSVWGYVGFIDLDNPGTRKYTVTVPANVGRLRLEFRQCVPSQRGFTQLDQSMQLTFLIDGTPIPDSEVWVIDFNNGGQYPYCRRWGTLLSEMTPAMRAVLAINYTWTKTLSLPNFVIPAGNYSQVVNVTFK